MQVPYEPNNFRMFAPGGRTWPAKQFPALQITPQWPAAGSFDIREHGELFCTYNIGPTAEQVRAGRAVFMRPFLYPVIGPDGIPLTGFGKPHDPTGSHRHHYSLWIAHNSVDGSDFWSEKGGSITSEGFDRIAQGPVFAEIVHRTSWRTGLAEVLKERRTTRCYARGEGVRLIDIKIEFSPAGENAVTFGRTSFGFLATRVSATMSPFDGGGEIRNSEGDVNEQQAHLRRAKWLDQAGPISTGKWGGVAILDHPENPRHPTGWHCRNDGWAGASFNIDEAFKLERGTNLVLRYRVVLHSGTAAQAQIARRHSEFAARPQVHVLGATRVEP